MGQGISISCSLPLLLNCSSSLFPYASCFDCPAHRVGRGCPTQSRLHVLVSAVHRRPGSLLVPLIHSCERGADWPGSDEPSIIGPGFCGPELGSQSKQSNGLGTKERSPKCAPQAKGRGEHREEADRPALVELQPDAAVCSRHSGFREAERETLGAWLGAPGSPGRDHS